VSLFNVEAALATQMSLAQAVRPNGIFSRCPGGPVHHWYNAMQYNDNVQCMRAMALHHRISYSYYIKSITLNSCFM